MTTKQEIIEFIRNSDLRYAMCLYSGSKFDPLEDKLIQMIQDLKPEIKVKKLVWPPSSSTSLCGKYYWDDIDGYVSAYYRYAGETNYLGIFDYVSQAQEACQKHWDKYVLSLVEVE